MPEISEVFFTLLAGAAGGGASWAAMQGRIARLDEIVAELKAEKASKESLDAVKASITSMREEMDKRFDRIEAMIQTAVIGGERR